MTITWIQKSKTLFSSQDGKFTIEKHEGEIGHYVALSCTKNNGVTKVYYYETIGEAFVGAYNIGDN